MNISVEDIKKIIEDASKKGFKIGVRDIAFVVLLDAFENEDIAYKCLFGSESGFMQEYASVYARTGAVEYIKDYIDILSSNNGSRSKKQDVDDITFDENKAYMIKLKKDTEEAMANGEIEKKDALKILADISVKLNDKFNVKDANEDRQVVIVQNKFNAICECGREIYVPTKEEMMKKYNLIEKDIDVKDNNLM